MRIAVLDLGTNTFHLLIVDAGKDFSFENIFKSKLTVKLLEGSDGAKKIEAEPFQRGVDAMKHYSEIIKEHRAEKAFAFATSGIRSAANGKKFVAEVKKQTGISIEVISGVKEAELIYYGALQCVKLGTEPVLIMDIGGGSTEFIVANDEKIFWKHSFNIGAARLISKFNPSNPVSKKEISEIENYLEEILQPLFEVMKKYSISRLVGSSGSFDTLAEMIGWKFHKHNPLKGVNTYEFNLKEYFSLHETILKSTTEERMKMKGLVKMRVDMIVTATICTNFILKKLGLREMILSKFALKEGALWEIIEREKSREL